MKHRYQRIADRSISCATVALGSGHHEKAGFLSYHAFESAGAALGTHVGLDMGAGVAHSKKIRRFLHASKSIGAERSVALLAVKLGSMRNRFLYPEVLPSGVVRAPEDQITPAKANELLKQVRHVVGIVKASL